MTTQWKAALEAFLTEEQLAHLLIDRVRVDEDAARMDIFFTSSDIVYPQPMLTQMERALAPLFPAAKRIRVQVSSPALWEAFCADPMPYADVLTGFLELRLPTCRVWLEDAGWKMQADQLRITVQEAAGLDYFEQKDGAGVLGGIIKYLFRQDLRVVFRTRQAADEQDAAWAQLREQSQLELQRIAEEAALAEVAVQKKERKARKRLNESGETIMGRPIRDEPVQIRSLGETIGRVTVQGRVFEVTDKELPKSKTHKLLFSLYDRTESVTVKLMLSADEAARMMDILGKAANKQEWLVVRGDYRPDMYENNMPILTAQDIVPAEDPDLRMDEAADKRIELHLHTKMSAMDGFVEIKDAVNRAADWGHEAVAITDHGVVHAFPEAYYASLSRKIKLILGMEGYLLDNTLNVVLHPDDRPLDGPIVIFDVETTGLSPLTCGITELGAVRIENGEIVDRFSSFCNPGHPIPPEITKLTGIDDSMVAGAPLPKQVVADFLQFCEGAALAAHNAEFDVSFVRAAAQERAAAFERPALDTLALARGLYPALRSHRLGAVSKHLGIKLERAHRAVNDAEATAQVLLAMLKDCREKGAHTLADLNSLFTGSGHVRPYHVVLLVQSKQGLKNLYTLVSQSHLEYFHRHPLIPRALLEKHREGLLVGSACEAGELFRAVMGGKPENDILRIAKFYDYLEIQPDGNNEFLLREGKLRDVQALHEINRRILALGDKLGKPVVATGDVHFLDPEDECFRRIILTGMQMNDADQQPPLYFKTTDEMLKEFAYLGRENARRVVIDAPKQIADSIPVISPLANGLFAPELPDADNIVTDMSWDTAKRLYGDPVPEPIRLRLEKELGVILNYKYASLYLSAQKLVHKSMSDGYLVGSRGSVGSSLVATMMGISEVNPMASHYRCAQCRYSNFEVDRKKYPLGADLPDAQCPVCGAPLVKDGYDIPFEVFLGFKGDKIPDIDLNFSGEYQPQAHKYTEVIYGKTQVFRAGTLGTLAQKTAYGYVMKYIEQTGARYSHAEVNRLVAGCTGVKRSTGQHPGGIVIVPAGHDINEFTPVQHPADDKAKGIVTTHFDYHAIEPNLVKLDILGHDGPTIIRMLQDMTGVDPLGIEIGEKKTLEIFSSTQPLGVSPQQIGCPVGTLGIPEFGTGFVRQMLVDTKPTTIEELVRIAGLSHGTDVWLGNAQELIAQGVVPLSGCICTRDDIMNYLSQMMDPFDAFQIMENVRKGLGLVLKKSGKDMEGPMRDAGVPEWFIESCKKIKYMFPKGHAAAYVMMSFRIAYYKVYHPEAFYAAYFSIHADEFDAPMMLGDAEQVAQAIQLLGQKGNELTAREKGSYALLESVREMLARGIRFVPLDLYQSHPLRFTLQQGGIRPPLCSLPGLGENAALAIEQARGEGEFLSIEDLQMRSRISKSVIEAMKACGCLDGMSQTSQISLF